MPQRIEDEQPFIPIVGFALDRFRQNRIDRSVLNHALAGAADRGLRSVMEKHISRIIMELPASLEDCRCVPMNSQLAVETSYFDGTKGFIMPPVGRNHFACTVFAAGIGISGCIQPVIGKEQVTAAIAKALAGRTTFQGIREQINMRNSQKSNDSPVRACLPVWIEPSTESFEMGIGTAITGAFDGFQELCQSRTPNEIHLILTGLFGTDAATIKTALDITQEVIANYPTSYEIKEANFIQDDRLPIGLLYTGPTQPFFFPLRYDQDDCTDNIYEE